VNHILENQQPETLFIEESVMRILQRVIAKSYLQRGLHPARTKVSQELEVVNEIQKLLATCFEQKLSLELISSRINYSPFHLCRIFRKYTGQSIRRYLNQLRLRAALEDVTQSGTDLTNLALRMGFASHSHFTEAFRKTFGVPPSTLRNASQHRVRQFLSKISIA
jgi:transcriptional regulator GlxA family with amidase domain